MKYTILIILVVLGAMAFMSNDFLNILADSSSIIFFGAVTTAMISIASIIAIDTAKLLNYKILNNELENLKDELYQHITRNVFKIEFSEDSIKKYQELKKLDKKILDMKGFNYENR